MKASELIASTKEIGNLKLEADIQDANVVVKENSKKVFYFSIPSNLSDEEIKKEFVGYLSVKKEE